MQKTAQETDNKFKAKCKVEIQRQNSPYDYEEQLEPECYVDFLINFEYKTWGINGVYITILPQTCTVITSGLRGLRSQPDVEFQEYNQKISFDPSKMKISSSKEYDQDSKVITVDRILLDANDNGEVNYTESSVVTFV